MLLRCLGTCYFNLPWELSPSRMSPATAQLLAVIEDRPLVTTVRARFWHPGILPRGVFTGDDIALGESQPLLIETNVTVAAANHHVVQQLDTQQLAGRHQIPGYENIFCAGCRVAGGMVVYQDY